jgi:ATP-binding cassette subfamily F protein 3
MFYQVEQAICEVGLDLSDQDLRISCLSGGQKMRVRLAKILMEEPTVLLFDEPTNHVDDAGKNFLASFMKNFSGSVFFVTHDRKFLAQVTNMIIEVTPEQRVEAYTGSYSEYLIAQKERFDRQMVTYEKQQKEIAEIEMWLRENEFHPKFRFSDRVMSQKKILDKLLASAMPRPIRDPEISYNITFPKSEGTVLTVKNLSMSFENKQLFQNVSFVLHGTERIFVG